MTQEETAGYQAVTTRTMVEKKNKPAKRKSQQLLPALAALGSACGLATVPAGALELGELKVDSTLGQPLRASIAYALNPNEQLFDFCIYLRPGVVGSGIPTVSRAQISVTNNSIILTGNAPIREPLLSMQVAVDCPYTPHLLREYTLMVDPAAPAAAETATSVSRTVSEPIRLPTETAPVARQARSVPARQRSAAPGARTVADQSPIAMQSSYRVRAGDTLSTIVSRIEGRTIGLWPAVDSIFAANPKAFIDNDVNRLMAGSVIDIPDMTLVTSAERTPLTAPLAGTSAAATAEEAAGASTGTDTASPVAEIEVADAEAAAANATPALAEIAIPDQSVVAESADTEAAGTAMSELRPGDVIMAPIGADPGEVGIAETKIDNQPAAIVAPVPSSGGAESSRPDGWSWLMWLGGTGLALILGLLFFGRTLRERFGSTAVGAPEMAPRRHDDDPTQKNFIIQEVDLDFEDTVNARAISLDADLEAGTGFQDSVDMDVAQDFGFTATGAGRANLDMEITEEDAREPERQPTDVIAPNHRIESSSILEKEVLPDEHADEADYDMSMIVDATKQPIGDYDATAKDLQAVPVELDDDEYTVTDDTLNNEIDYKILEQDYEEELTATQALNIEIEKAAQELVDRMDDDDETGEITAENPALDHTAAMPGSDSTAEMPPAAVTTEMPAAEITAEMPYVSDPDNTAELTASIPTEIEAENDDEADARESATTVEMAASGSDVTVEMEVESGKVDTKKKK